MLVVSQPPPLAFLVFLLSDWWEACATSSAVGGGAPVPRSAGTGNREGGALPAIASRSGEAGGLPPNPAAFEVTRPEPRNDRRNTRKTLSFPHETSTRQ